MIGAVIRLIKQLLLASGIQTPTRSQRWPDNDWPEGTTVPSLICYLSCSPQSRNLSSEWSLCGVSRELSSPGPTSLPSGHLPYNPQALQSQLLPPWQTSRVWPQVQRYEGLGSLGGAGHFALEKSPPPHLVTLHILGLRGQAYFPPALDKLPSNQVSGQIR